MDNLGYILKDVLHSKADMIKGLGDIEVPDYREFMDKLSADQASRSRVIDLKERNNGHKGRRTAKKAIMVVACIVILSLGFSVAADIPTVKAFRFNIVTTLMEIRDGFLSITQSDIGDDEAANDSMSNQENNDNALDNDKAGLKHKALIPSYIPDGYKLKAVKETPLLDGDYIIKQSYENDQNGYINIMQISNVKDFNANAITNASGKTIKIGNKEVVLLSTDDDSIYAVWYDDDIQYEIVATISENDVVKMIESMI